MNPDYTVRVAFAGSSGTGKTTTIKAMQMINFMESLGITDPEQQRTFYQNDNLIKELKERGSGLNDLLDSLYFKKEDGKMNYTKLEDFVNNSMIREIVEPHPIRKRFKEDVNGNLRIKRRLDSELITSDYLPIDLKTDLARTCEMILLADGKDLSLKNIVKETVSTRTFSMKEVSDKRLPNTEEQVLMNIGGKTTRVLIKDLGGQRKYEYVRPRLHKGIDAEVIFFGHDKRASLQDVGAYEPDSVGFPEYKELDEVNLPMLLNFLKMTNQEHYQEFTTNIPENYRKNLDKISTKLAKSDTKKSNKRETVKRVIENWFPEDFYQEFQKNHPEYNQPSYSGWVMEVCNTRYLMKEKENDFTMVPLVLYGNRADLVTEESKDRVMNYLTKKPGLKELPYLSGSATTLENIKPLFETVTLLALSASGQISQEDYNNGMREASENIKGKHSINKWFQGDNA